VDAVRPLSFRSAAELTGLSVRELKARVRAGHLDAVVLAGRPTAVELSALVAAGLLPDTLLAAPRPGNGAAQAPPAERGTWVPVEQSQDLLRRLLSEREVLGVQWKERTESLYREIIDDQRARIGRLEEEKSELTRDLRDALRRIPKLMELEDLEAQRERMTQDLADRARQVEESEAQERRLRDSVERLERDLGESQRRRQELSERLRRLRARGVWDRLLDRDPPPSEDG